MLERDELRERFYSAQLTEGLSAGSMRSWKHQLGIFYRFLDQYGISSPLQATRSLLLEQLPDYLMKRTNRFGRVDCASARASIIITIKSFYRFLHTHGLLSHNPCKDLKPPKVPKRLPGAVLATREAMRILRAPDTQTLLGYRDRAILEVLYSTGMRRNELRNLRVEHLDLDDGLVRIEQGKGGKDRVIPLGTQCARFVATYLEAVRPFILAGREDQGWLFLSSRCKRMGSTRLMVMINHYAAQAGLKKHVTPHTFRRSCATGMLRNKAHPMYVKDILGHGSYSTLERYINLSAQDLKEAHKKHHPREQDVE